MRKKEKKKNSISRDESEVKKSCKLNRLDSLSPTGQSFGQQSFGGGSSGGFSGSSAQSFGGSSSGGFGGSSSGGFGGYSGGQQAAIIQKHIYVHVPPPEQEEIRAQRPIPVAPAQKHYKIIFIKAPSPPAYQAPIIPAQPQNEEKTLVYVLVKKPDEQQDIVIPTPAPTQPSKPEVYFIKYKTQKDSGSADGGYAGADFGASGSGYDSAPQNPQSQYGPPSKF
jgi:hypothetical protein